jgi:hypothetical protein
MRPRFFFFAPLLVLGFLGFVAFGGFIVQQLWNWLLPALFGWPVLTLWQALGLLALCRILFGGFGMHGGRGPYWRHERGRWRRWTDEERARFRHEIRQRVGVDPPASDPL